MRIQLLKEMETRGTSHKCSLFTASLLFNVCERKSEQSDLDHKDVGVGR